MAKPTMDDYVDVAERIQQFYEKYPDGRLTRVGDPEVMTVGNKVFVVYTAKAYRTADDPVPAIGTAWEPFPGPTAFTRDSELMNAETAAWGRAIIAVGIGSKRIASRQEYQARASDPLPPPPATLHPDNLVKVLKAVGDAGIPDEEWVTFRNSIGAPRDEDLTADMAKQVKAWMDERKVTA